MGEGLKVGKWEGGRFFGNLKFERGGRKGMMFGW